MSTRATIHFKTSRGEDYQFYIRSDGYPDTIIRSLWNIKLACEADIIKWKDLYEFIKKYDGSSGLRFIESDESEQLLEINSPEFFFVPFTDGYMTREGSYDVGSVQYEYYVGYKFRTIYEYMNGGKYNAKKCNAKNFWIQFLFGDEESFWAQERIYS